MTDALVPHFRIVYPSTIDKGILRTSRHAKVFVTFPGLEEIEVPRVKHVETHFGIDDADIVKIELYGTYEVQYGD
jgi:hypothetical protein